MVKHAHEFNLEDIIYKFQERDKKKIRIYIRTKWSTNEIRISDFIKEYRLNIC